MFVVEKIKEIIEKEGTSLIFTNTRASAELVSSLLKEDGVKIGVHHSSLSKESRMDAEKKLMNGEYSAVVCTSSLELGIDIGRISCVVQVMSPRQVVKLVQRVGRAGHKVDEVSKGYIITTDIDDFCEGEAIAEKQKKGWLEKPVKFENSLDVLCHQVVGFMVQGEDNLERIYKIIIRSPLYRNFKKKEFERLIEFMKRIRLISNDDEHWYRTRRGLMYYFENLSMIPSRRHYLIINGENNRKIGRLDEEFIISNIDLGSKFICRGEAWIVNEFEEDGARGVLAPNSDSQRRIIVSRTTPDSSSIPAWMGELMPVSYEVAMRAGELRGETAKDTFLVEWDSNKVVIHTSCGNKVNETLGRVLLSLSSQASGSRIMLRADSYRIMFELEDRKDWRKIAENLKKLKPEWIKTVLEHSIKNSNQYIYRFSKVCQRFGVMKKNAEHSRRLVRKLAEEYDDTPISEETLSEFFTEKFDIERSEGIVRRITSGEIKINVVHGFSDASKRGLAFGGWGEFLTTKSEEEILKIVKDRLMSKEFSFKCMNCGKELGIFKVRNCSRLRCSKCGARYIAPRNVKEEYRHKKEWDERARIFIDYGQKGVMVIAGKGIGTRTAKRILSKYFSDEKDLLKKIIEEERTYLRTKQYWSK